MKVVVTGGSGQLGSVVLRRLLDDRGIDHIVSIDVRPPIVASRSKLEAVSLDVRSAMLRNHLEGADAVVHLAFVVTGRADAEMESINVGGSRNVFEAAAAAGVKTIVYASSIAAYGVVAGHPDVLVESSPRRHQPEFPYSAHKYLVEEHLDAFEAAHPAIRVVRLRPSILMGARMDHVPLKALGLLVSHGLLPVISEAPAPFVWDEDVAQAVALALKKDVRGAFNLSADDPATGPDLARALHLRLVTIPRAGVDAAAWIGDLLERQGVRGTVDPSWRLANGVVLNPSSERAKRELGWTPRWSTTLNVFRRYLEVAPTSMDLRVRAFFGALELTGASLAGTAFEARALEDRALDVHLALSGRGGGDFALSAAAGRLTVRAGIPRPPAATVTVPIDLWLDLLAGRIGLAGVHGPGGMKVEGDPAGGLLVEALVLRHGRLFQVPGPGGQAVRAFTRWVTRGALPGD